jgi:hypothetical protein
LPVEKPTVKKLPLTLPIKELPDRCLDHAGPLQSVRMALDPRIERRQQVGIERDIRWPSGSVHDGQMPHACVIVNT